MALMRFCLLLALLGAGNMMYAQQREKAEKLVSEGVAYNDKGDYEGAITRFNKALALDKDNLMALAEKAYTLLTTKKYEESIACCKKAVESHPNSGDLKMVFVTYGSAYDELKKTDKSIEIYDQGIQQFPDFYLLHFNKGISLSSVKRYDEALVSLQKAVVLNPKHAGSHNAIARIMDTRNRHVPALLAYARFFVIEPQGERAKQNLDNLNRIMNGDSDVKKTSKKSINITLNADDLKDTTADGKLKDDNFVTIDMILSLGAALELEKKSKAKTETEHFINRFENVCSAMKEAQSKRHGFYWDYYVPYFVEMYDKHLVQTLGYLVNATSSDKDVSQWLKMHKEDIGKFYDWNTAYTWNTHVGEH